MGFSRQEFWSDLPFPSPVDHILSELSTMCHLSWVPLQGMAHSFIEIDKAVVHVISLVSFLWLWFSSVGPLMDKVKKINKLPDGRDWGGNWILFWWAGPCSVNLSSNFLLIGRAHLTWGQTMVEVMKIMANSFKRSHACTAALSASDPEAGHHWPTLHRRLLDSHAHVRISFFQDGLGKFRSQGSQVHPLKWTYPRSQHPYPGPESYKVVYWVSKFQIVKVIVFLIDVRIGP